MDERQRNQIESAAKQYGFWLGGNGDFPVKRILDVNGIGYLCNSAFTEGQPDYSQTHNKTDHFIAF